MMSALAEFERRTLSQRTKEGLEAARRRGKRIGGPVRDHKHRLRTVRPYAYRDAAGLLEDFWAEVEAVLKEKGLTL